MPYPVCVCVCVNDFLLVLLLLYDTLNRFEFK
jgi:hypothetical protein